MSEPFPVTHRELGPYQIVRTLGSGGMGEVLLGYKRGVHGFLQLVAIKTIRSDLAGVDAVREMFFDEAQLMAHLMHPRVAQVFDCGEDAGTLYLVMEYVGGVNFRDLIALAPPPAICARAVAEVCRGLHAAHELADPAGRPLRVVHRDVTPENLMITFEGWIKVVDFGIALMRGRRAPVTEYGAIKGKPPYLSPEQIRSEALDRRADIYAAALVLHEMLTGKPVYAGDSVFAIARAIEHQDVPPPSAMAGPLPAGLDEIVLRGLARAPGDRYQTAQEMAWALDEVAAGTKQLEEYTRGALAQRAGEHREMIASIWHGPPPTEGRTGRSTGQVTALAMDMGTPDPEPGVGATHRVERAVIERAVIERAVIGSEQDLAPAQTEIDAAGDARESRESGKPAAQAGFRRFRRILAVAALAVVLGWWVAYGVERQAQHGEADTVIADIAGANAAADAAPANDSTPAPRADGAAAANAGGAAASIDVPPAEPAQDTGQVTPPPRTPPDRPRKRSERKPARPPDAARIVADGGATDKSAAESPTHSPVAEEAAARKPSPQLPQGVGYITITAEPYGHVQLDGASVGPTPMFRRKLPPGVHEVVITRPDDGAVRLRRTVNLTPGEHLHLRAP